MTMSYSHFDDACFISGGSIAVGAYRRANEGGPCACRRRGRKKPLRLVKSILRKFISNSHRKPGEANSRPLGQGGKCRSQTARTLGQKLSPQADFARANPTYGLCTLESGAALCGRRIVLPRRDLRVLRVQNASCAEVERPSEGEIAIPANLNLRTQDLHDLVEVFRILTGGTRNKPHDEAETAISRKQAGLVGRQQPSDDHLSHQRRKQLDGVSLKAQEHHQNCLLRERWTLVSAR